MKSFMSYISRDILVNAVMWLRLFLGCYSNITKHRLVLRIIWLYYIFFFALFVYLSWNSPITTQIIFFIYNVYLIINFFIIFSVSLISDSEHFYKFYSSLLNIDKSSSYMLNRFDGVMSFCLIVLTQIVNVFNVVIVYYTYRNLNLVARIEVFLQVPILLHFTRIMMLELLWTRIKGLRISLERELLLASNVHENCDQIKCIKKHLQTYIHFFNLHCYSGSSIFLTLLALTSPAPSLLILIHSVSPHQFDTSTLTALTSLAPYLLIFIKVILRHNTQFDITETATEIAKREQETKNYSVVDLFKTPRLRRHSFLLILIWMSIAMVFDGHVRNVGSLGLDMFLTFTIATATEFPADILLILTLDILGRRWLAFGSMVVSGIFSFLATAVPYGLPSASLAIVGRFAVNISYNIGMQYAAELLPTVVRAQGLALIHIVGYIATVLVPYIVYMATIAKEIPLLILGTIGIIGGSLCLFLPESMGKNMPQTIRDGEEYGIEQKLWDMPCCPRKSLIED